MYKKSSADKKAQALRLAKDIGCVGAHEDEKGNWMPCSSHDELNRISDIAETSKWRSVVPDSKKQDKPRTKGKRKKRRDDWEYLRESPIRGIGSLDGGGIVSGVSFGSKSSGPEYVRDNDPDVFLDPESARFRSRQIGCIGISRRVSKNGRTVWMPCSNMTDYANRTGSTSLGKRNMSKRRQNDAREAVRTVLRERPKETLKRKVSLMRELTES
jgi:hypothetical protein